MHINFSGETSRRLCGGVWEKCVLPFTRGKVGSPNISCY